MCDPTLAMLGIAAFTATTTYVSSERQAAYQESVAKNNAIVLGRLAEDAIQRGQKDEMEHRLKVARFKSRQRAELAASGVDVNEGSASDLQADTMMLGELDALTIRNNAERESYRYLTGQQQELAQGRLTSMALRDEGRASLLSGAGRVANYWYAGKQPSANPGGR